jgi:hypothetical protein
MTCSADCRQRQESVCALALGGLESSEATELRQHVQSCPDCSTLFDAIENEEPALRAAFEAMAERAARRTGLLRGRGVPPVAAGTVPLVRPARRVKSFYRVVAAGLAVAVLLAAGSALILSLSSQQAAYAIEQTVEALKGVRFLHLVNRTEDAKAADERWIEVGHGIGGIFGPILGGRLGDLGNFPLAFSICGILCLAAAGIIAAVRPPHPKPAA